MKAVRQNRYTSGRALVEQKGLKVGGLCFCPSSRSPYVIKYSVLSQERRKAFTSRESAKAFLATLQQSQAIVEQLLEAGLVAADDNKTCGKDLGKAIEEFILAKEATGKSWRTVKSLKVELRRFAAESKVRLVAEITPKIVDKYVSDKGISARTRINVWLRLSCFFNWCSHPVRGYLDRNPCERTEKPACVKKDENPSTLTLTQVDKVLATAEQIGRLKVVALQLLAGLRPGEAAELPMSSIQDDYVAVVGVGKLRNKCRRLVPVCGRLKAMLATIRIRSQQYGLDYGSRRRLEKLSGVKLPQNVMRHTFVSNRVALVGRVQAAEEAGNSAGVVTRFYLDPKKKEDAMAYFG